MIIQCNFDIDDKQEPKRPVLQFTRYRFESVDGSTRYDDAEQSRYKQKEKIGSLILETHIVITMRLGEHARLLAYIIAYARSLRLIVSL